MATTSNAITVGMQPGGETAAGQLSHAGKQVTVIERELLGESWRHGGQGQAGRVTGPGAVDVGAVLRE